MGWSALTSHYGLSRLRCACPRSEKVFRWRRTAQVGRCASARLDSSSDAALADSDSITEFDKDGHSLPCDTLNNNLTDCARKGLFRSVTAQRSVRFTQQKRLHPKSPTPSWSPLNHGIEVRLTTAAASPEGIPRAVASCPGGDTRRAHRFRTACGELCSRPYGRRLTAVRVRCSRRGEGGNGTGEIKRDNAARLRDQSPQISVVVISNNVGLVKTHVLRSGCRSGLSRARESAEAAVPRCRDVTGDRVHPQRSACPCHCITTTG
jgi:hypothetical protein